MKKWISLILVAVLCLTAAACTRVKADNLMEEIPEGTGTPGKVQAADTAAMADFGIQLFQQSMTAGENTLISPLSVLAALSMTANGADGQTLEQMEAVFGMDVESLNQWFSAYMAQLPETENCKLRLANSIWFRDVPTLTVERDFLQRNADYYGASVYKAPFDDTTVNDINAWVNEHTDGMISQILDEIPQETMLYLINALAFDAQWQEIYEETQIRDGIFTREDGIERDVELMHSEEGAYLEDDLATGFLKYYQGRKFAFVALLPKEGVSVDEYVASLTGEHVMELLEEPESLTVFAAIPKFEMEYSLEMKEILAQMGMTDAFSGMAADFSRMGSSSDGNLFIGRVIHKTFISVDERGTQAGAVTAVQMDTESAPVILDSRTVVLDRPFVYMLLDCETNLPFFLGTMMDAGTEGETIHEPGSSGASEPSLDFPPQLSVKDDHTHQLAEQPQTVEDPISGYCGNTQTTVYLDGDRYTFMYDDSVALTDILINLDYDPMKICNCMAEFTVDTEFGKGYGVNLTEGYARSPEGQADLTAEQTERIRQIIENLK